MLELKRVGQQWACDKWSHRPNTSYTGAATLARAPQCSQNFRLRCSSARSCAQNSDREVPNCTFDQVSHKRASFILSLVLKELDCCQNFQNYVLTVVQLILLDLLKHDSNVYPLSFCRPQFYLFIIFLKNLRTNCYHLCYIYLNLNRSNWVLARFLVFIKLIWPLLEVKSSIVDDCRAECFVNSC